MITQEFVFIIYPVQVSQKNMKNNKINKWSKNLSINNQLNIIKNLMKLKKLNLAKVAQKQ